MSFAVMLPTTSSALMLPSTSSTSPTVIRTIPPSNEQPRTQAPNNDQHRIQAPNNDQHRSQAPNNDQHRSQAPNNDQLSPLEMRQIEPVRRIVMGGETMLMSEQIEHLTNQLQGVDQKTLQAIPALLQHMTKGAMANHHTEHRSHDLSPPISGQVPALLQYMAKGSKAWPNSTPVTTIAMPQGPSMAVCQIDTNNYTAQAVEQQLATATQLIERYQMQNMNSQPITAQNTSHMTSPPILIPKGQQVISPKAYDQSKPPDENNSRRLRWKEEHGRALISIWKDKYPQVRSAKKIKEKHAIWHEIGAAYNLMCIRNDWPNRSTDQVKIKVKNCIDEYKQTIKYNQEYKTCPYFRDIDDIFGMSDPDKSLELAAAQQNSPQYNTDNAYWSGSSLPTQVKKRKLNISCASLVTDGEQEQLKVEPANQPQVSNSTFINGHQRDVLLLMNNQYTPVMGESFTRIHPKSIKQEARNTESRDESPQQRMDGSSPTTSPQTPQTKAEDFTEHNLNNQFSDIIRQIHDREDRLIEVYHRIDLERRESYLQRERERQAAELQMESSRQRFLGSIIEKLIDIIKERKKQECTCAPLEVVDESKELHGG